MPPVELQRKRSSDNVTVPWLLVDTDTANPAGIASDPVVDFGARATLVSILNKLGSVTLDAATLNALETINAIVSGSVMISNFPATQPVSGPLTDTQLRASAPAVKDDYQAGECLADQTGAGAVLTFTFAQPRNLILIEAVGSGTQIARVDPFGGLPTASLGIRADDGIPTYLPITTTIVKIFAPVGMVVSVAGFSRI